MNNISTRVAAERIEKVLDFLKEMKVHQQEIQEKLNYTSLSKAKNFDKYPQKIIERRTRTELLEQLLEQFGLDYDEENDRVLRLNEGDIKKSYSPELVFYMMYYYAFARKTIGKAIIKVINKKRVVIHYQIDEYWEGIYDIVENYTFIEAQKTGIATPVKKLISLFTGTKKFGRPILLGTYSTVKRDGFPAAGKVLLERIADENAAFQRLEAAVDPRIIAYLQRSVMVSETFTPNTLDELNTHYEHLLHVSGEYVFIFPGKSGQWQQGILQLDENSFASLQTNDMSFQGYARYLDLNTLKIDFDVERVYLNQLEGQISIQVNTRKKFDHLFYATGMSNILHGCASSFACYLIQKEYFNMQDIEKNTSINKTVVLTEL